MQYTKTLTTKTGSELYLRNGDAPDGCAALAVFNKTHAPTAWQGITSDCVWLLCAAEKLAK